VPQLLLSCQKYTISTAATAEPSNASQPKMASECCATQDQSATERGHRAARAQHHSRWAKPAKPPGSTNSKTMNKTPKYKSQAGVHDDPTTSATTMSTAPNKGPAKAVAPPMNANKR
jgi:hypothetical protein